MTFLPRDRETIVSHEPPIAVRVVVAALASCFACPQASAGEDASVCVSTVPATAAGNHVDPGAARAGTPYVFDLVIDDRAPVSLRTDKAVLVAGLSHADRHLVVIRQDGKPRESFRFRFDQYGEDALCLWFNDFYETWSLWPMGDSKGKGCSCASTP